MGKSRLTTLNSLFTEARTITSNELKTTAVSIKTKATTLATTLKTSTQSTKHTKITTTTVRSTTRTRGCYDYYNEYNEYCAVVDLWTGHKHYIYNAYGYFNENQEYVHFYPRSDEYYEDSYDVYEYKDFYKPADYFDIPSLDHVTGAITMGTITLITLPVLLLAIYVIKVNDKIANDIKPLFYIETMCRVLIIIIQSSWGLQGLFYVFTDTDFYVEEGIWNYWVCDRVLAFLFYVMGFTIAMTQLMMSLNRFFAVGFNGLYYHRIQCKIYCKILFVFAPSVLLNVPFLIPSLYVPGMAADLMQFEVLAAYQRRDNYDGDLYHFWLTRYDYAIHFFIPMLLWLVESVLDCMVLRTVFRNARKTRDSQTKKRSMEVRLALTTLINHCANAGCTVGAYLSNFWRYSQTFRYAAGTICPLTIYTLFGLNIIIFLWTRRERNDNSTSSKTSKTV